MDMILIVSILIIAAVIVAIVLNKGINKKESDIPEPIQQVTTPAEDSGNIGSKIPEALSTIELEKQTDKDNTTAAQVTKPKRTRTKKVVKKAEVK